MCTGIKMNYDDGCVMARTMDYEVPLNYNVIYLPRNYNFCKEMKDRAFDADYYIEKLDKSSGDIEILLDYETRETITLKELIPDWWGYDRFKE